MHDQSYKNSDEELLARLGYKQEFRRVYGTFEVMGLAITMLSSGTAMASVLSISLSNGGAAEMVWGWGICSLFILCIGAALAEIASSAPTAGGLYYLTYNLCSPRYRRIYCWLVGYASTTSYVSGLASMNWGLAGQISAAASIGSDLHFHPTLKQSYGIYIALLLSQAILCSLGAKILARLQIVYLALNIIICFIVVLAFPIATPSRLMNSASYAFGNITNTTSWPNPFAFILGMLAPMWAIGGYDGPLHMSEEVANAAIAVPRTIVSAISFTAVFGFAINISLAFSMGTDIRGLLNSPVGQPMAQIALNSFGKSWTLALWSAIIITQYAACANTLLVASRQMFAFARDGVLPLSTWLRRFNRRTATPVNSVWCAVLLCLLLGLLCLCGPAAISAIFSIPIIGQNIAFTIPIAARFVFENNFKPGPFTLGRLGGPVAVIAVLFQIIMTIVLCFPTNPNPTAADMNYTSAVIGSVMLFALTWYYFPYYGAVYWFEGPVLNVTPSTPAIPDQMEDSEKEAGVEIKVD